MSANVLQYPQLQKPVHAPPPPRGAAGRALDAQVTFDLRSCAVAISDAANVMRANLQQTWTIADLLAKFHGYDRATLLALLATHCGVRFDKGQPVVVHLDHYLVLADVVRRELAR